MKKILTSRIFLVLLTAIIVASGTAYATIKIQATEIGYDGGAWKKSNGEDITNVKDAIDELYKNKQLVKNGDIIYKESYNHIRYNELRQGLNVGTYICSYNYASPSIDTSVNLRTTFDTFGVTVNGCDEYIELNRNSYKTTGSTNFLTNTTTTQFNATINFNCKMDSYKEIEIIFNGDNSSANSVAANLLCIPITIN